MIARTATSATTRVNRTRHARLAPKAKPAPVRAAWLPTATADANSDANFRRLRRANRGRITVQTARCRADAMFAHPAERAMNCLAALAVRNPARQDIRHQQHRAMQDMLLKQTVLPAEMRAASALQRPARQDIRHQQHRAVRDIHLKQTVLPAEMRVASALQRPVRRDIRHPQHRAVLSRRWKQKECRGKKIAASVLMFPVPVTNLHGTVQNVLNVPVIFIVPTINIAKTMFACWRRDVAKPDRTANRQVTAASVIRACRCVRQKHVRERRRNVTFRIINWSVANVAEIRAERDTNAELKLR